MSGHSYAARVFPLDDVSILTFHLPETSASTSHLAARNSLGRGPLESLS